MQHREKRVKRDNYAGRLGLMILLATLIGICSSCATARAPSPSGSAPALISTPKVEKTELSPFTIPFYRHPERMELCGEPVPLNLQEVSERFDKEFTLVVYNHAQVFLWLKRMERYFPWIEDQLRRFGLPDDLKYVAVAESDLLPNACSPKGAAGPWQFMPKTGSRYGLDQRGTCDERYDFELATGSAFRYLQDLHRRFNNWSLAIAAYNCGEGRVQEEMRSQRMSDYYHLKLPLETERYVFRILAMKAVLGNPSRYGYVLPKGEGYPELRVDRKSITAPNPTPIKDVAEAAGTTYREIKRLNPSLRADEIPAGTIEVKLPEGKGKVLEQNLQTVAPGPASGQHKSSESTAGTANPVKQPSRPVEKPAKGPAHHVVKKGDTLSNIAQRYNVSVESLRKANKLKDSNIVLGAKLIIP
jgi:membrane-bound lytic murein transglycosylase D